MAAKTKAKAKARTLAVVEVPDGNDQADTDEEDETRGIPLFEGLSEEVKVEVYRVEPIEEGTLGSLDRSADEATIARRWGGGVYRVTAKGSDGRFGRKQRTVTIAGDPKFESKEAQRRWRIKMGEIVEDGAGGKPAAVGPGLDLPGLLSIIQASHQNSMAFMQAQLSAQQQQSQQQVMATAKLADEGRQRDREFFATMLQLQQRDQKQSDPLAMVPLMVKFLELGKNMAAPAGGEAGDPVTAFIQALPVILPQAQAMLSGQAAQPAPANEAAPPAPAAGPQQPRMVVTGDIALQLDATFRALQAKGYDAEKAMTLALQQLAQVPNAPAKPAPAPPAAPPEASSSEPEPPRAAAAGGGGGNGTSRAPRATRRK